MVFTGRKNLYFKVEKACLIAITLSKPERTVNLNKLSAAKSKTSGSSVNLFSRDKNWLLT